MGHVADSPYNIDVQPKVDVAKTLCHGPGLEDGILDTQPTHFMIETRDQDGNPLNEKGANQPFVVDIQGPDGKVPAKIKDNKDGIILIIIPFFFCSTIVQELTVWTMNLPLLEIITL